MELAEQHDKEAAKDAEEAAAPKKEEKDGKEDKEKKEPKKPWSYISLSDGVGTHSKEQV